ncbi:hypothetical protein B0H19DRAFT_376507 [Mycena capillaripes]|nr:hypothetical protein B0H19DRAFT_376507 [Mycena capillaripes]
MQRHARELGLVFPLERCTAARIPASTSLPPSWFYLHVPHLPRRLRQCRTWYFLDTLPLLGARVRILVLNSHRLCSLPLRVTCKLPRCTLTLLLNQNGQTQRKGKPHTDERYNLVLRSPCTRPAPSPFFSWPSSAVPASFLTPDLPAVLIYLRSRTGRESALARAEPLVFFIPLIDPSLYMCRNEAGLGVFDIPPSSFFFTHLRARYS